MPSGHPNFRAGTAPLPRDAILLGPAYYADWQRNMQQAKASGDKAWVSRLDVLYKEDIKKAEALEQEWAEVTSPKAPAKKESPAPYEKFLSVLMSDVFGFRK